MAHNFKKKTERKRNQNSRAKTLTQLNNVSDFHYGWVILEFNKTTGKFRTALCVRELFNLSASRKRVIIWDGFRKL